MTDPRVFVYSVTRTGATAGFLGSGSLLTDSIVVLHPPTNEECAKEFAEAKDPVPVRCQIVRPSGRARVINGALTPPTSPLPGPPAGIVLRWVWSEPFDSLILNAAGFSSDPTSQAQSLQDALVSIAHDDPVTPPLPPPRQGNGGRASKTEIPTGRPWYCAFVSHGPGC